MSNNSSFIIRNIKVITNASRNMISGDILTEDVKIHLNAIPENGKANKLLIKFLSKKLNISKSSIVIEKGEKSKNKVIKIFI